MNLKIKNYNLRNFRKINNKKTVNKKAFALTELIVYLVLFTTVFIFFSQIYLKTYTDYLLEVKKLKHIDYSYIAFERIKNDLYNFPESVNVKDNIVFIKKTSSVNAPYIKLYMKDNKLRYTFGKDEFQDKSLFYICYELKGFNAYIKNNILFIRLEFEDLVIERGFLIEI